MENEEVLTTQDDASLYADALDSLESTDVAAPTDAGETAGDKAATPADASETAEQTAERLRDEKGRYAPGKAEVTAAPTAPVIPAPKINRPSSWKKDHWESFDKLATENPALAQYINQRESEFATGVSTYKQEYDRLKPLDEAIAPILPILQQHGREPGEWIQTMGRVHQTFAFGSPQQKVQATLQLLKDYNVPLMDYITQGGQLPQFNPNAQQQPTPQPQPDIGALVNAKFQEYQTQQSIKQFQEAKDAAGNPQYPHFSTVRNDMIGLLQAGLATDLPSAYDKALRMHDDIWQQQLAEKAEQAAAEKAAAAQAKVNRARRNNVSITDSARSADMTTGGDKELRNQYAEGLDAAMSGRV